MSLYDDLQGGFDLQAAYEELEALREANDYDGWLERAWRLPAECPLIRDEMHRLAATTPTTILTLMATLVLLESEARSRRAKQLEQLEDGLE